MLHGHSYPDMDMALHASDGGQHSSPKASTRHTKTTQTR